MKNVLVFLLTIISLQSGAQQVMWKRFNSHNGLNAASIICITQSADGLIWLGTQDGLISFNGNRFTDISIGNYKPYVEGITCDNKGRLWLGCRDGLRIYTPASGLWQSFTTHPSLGKKMREVVPSYDTQYVYLVSEKGLLKVKTDNPLQVEIVDPELFEHVECDRNNVWAQSRRSLVTWHQNRKQTVIANTDVFDCKRIPGEERLLVVTAKGFCWIKPDLSIEPANIKAPINLLKLGAFHVIFPETNGKKIWIKQYDTVFCLNGVSDPNPEIHYWNHLNPYGIPQQALQIFPDSYGNIWMLSGGDGLSLLSARTRSLRFVPSEVAQTSTIWNVLEDPQTKQTVYCTQQSVSILNLRTGIFKKLKPPIPENRFTCSQIVT
jgi:ligand-binding sensor domain-containing protein